MIQFGLFITLLLLTSSLASPLTRDDEDCPSSCKLPDCRCSSTNVPGGLNPEDIPQIVLLTFDDAVQVINYNFYSDALFNKKNPDGCPIGATYFVSHEYTDYKMLHDLYQHGHEVALHSITHTTMTEYWGTADVELLKAEFGGEREMIEKFANIPKEHIYGIRIPFLQMSGDNITQALKELGFQYDCSWPTQIYTEPEGLWPYTFDYPSMQDCPIGPCPEKSVPGLWEQPMLNMRDNSGVTCAMADACVDVPKDVEGLFEFMKRNFEVQYKGNRAPFGFYVHAAWFVTDNNRFEAYKKFVDYLVELDDVYIVTVQRGLEWVRNPNTLSDIKKTWPECFKPVQSTCSKQTCQLKKEEEERYMTFCGSNCPKKYPWLYNPLGQ